MAVGRREESRQLLLQHGQVIGRLFADGVTSEEMTENFLQYGMFGSCRRVVEDRRTVVDEMAAKILANNNKIDFDGLLKYARSR